MGLSICIKTTDQRTNTKRSHSTFLGILLLSLSNKFRDILDWRTVIIIQTITLALDTCLVRKNTTISSKPRIGHMNVVIELHNFFNCPTLLQFRHCFFLHIRRDTSTARMTEDSVTSPTAHSPFLTASIAYSTWKRCPLGENTVMAVSYI